MMMIWNDAASRPILTEYIFLTEYRYDYLIALPMNNMEYIIHDPEGYPLSEMVIARYVFNKQVDRHVYRYKFSGVEIRK